jgi:hypothetical protein
MRIAPTNPTQLPGAWHDLPTFVGGKTFPSLAAFKEAIGSGHAVLRPGDKVSIRMPLRPGVAVPTVTGFNKNSPYSAKYANGKLTISVSDKARMGIVDRLSVNTGPLVAPTATPPKSKTNITFETGIGRIRLG